MSDETAMVSMAEMPPMPVQEQEGALIASWQRRAATLVSSIDATTPKGKSDFLRALATADRLAKHTVGTDLAVADWLLHEIRLTNPEDGESTPALRLVLILEDGSTVSTTSEVVLNNWRHVVSMFGTKTFDPPLIIRLQARKAKTVGEYLEIGMIGKRPEPAVRKSK